MSPQLPLLSRIAEVLAPFVSARRQARIEEVLDARTREVVLVLENIYSDHNASAVLRTAEALGLLELRFVANKSAFRVEPSISQGAHKWLDVSRHDSIVDAYSRLKDRGYQVWASHFHTASVDVSELPVAGPIALVFGNEHDGLTQPAIEHADGHFRVPMRGFVESLNISVAAAISAYDVVSRRPSLAPLTDQEKTELRAHWYAKSVRAADQILANEGLSLPPRAT